MRTARHRIYLCTSTVLVGALLGATPAIADVVTDWNAKTISYVNAASRPAPAWILDVAMVQLAIHDSVQAYEQRFASYNEPIVGAAGSPVARWPRPPATCSSIGFPLKPVPSTQRIWIISLKTAC